MKYLIIALAVVLCACGKGESPKPSTPTTSTLASVGIETSKNYHVSTNAHALFGYIRFNDNGTVSEFNSADTFTYTVNYLYYSNFSASILQGGKGIKVYIPSATTDSAQKGTFFDGCYILSGHTDTAVLGVYLQGDLVQASQPTLGCVFPANHSNLKYAYFTP